MAEVQRAAVRGLRAAIAMIGRSRIAGNGALRLDGRPLTSERVRARIQEELFALDCLGRDTIVAGGAQAADPHERGRGPLYAHELIVIDIFPQHMGNGYWGDLTRTVIKGRPRPDQRRMYQAVKAAQRRALTLVRPGVALARVHREVQRELDRRGFQTGETDGVPSGFIHGTGHGVGLEVHEAPTLGTAPGRLRRGNVVTIEPGLYYPGVGGVRIEDTIVVTPGGCRPLARCGNVFEV